jgi:hypothetical protein
MSYLSIDSKIDFILNKNMKKDDIDNIMSNLMI